MEEDFIYLLLSRLHHVDVGGKERAFIRKERRWALIRLICFVHFAEMESVNFKILIIGDSGTGKSR